MQGDENPLRLPPAEGRKGGERGFRDQVLEVRVWMSATGTAKATKHAKAGEMLSNDQRNQAQNWA
ncbi:hypothetical protein SE18_12405 [Herpetosiphon geysericola]|uniref:Uncharacterized protein n=1 Tax=Herpetosiphon geysericola TaxID=70996 RepID=A0A0P6XTS4_9CHLR|nr:hypothetical protein SE18_12405 [Herpetosiphon geysericola]